MMPRHQSLERRVADLLEERRDPATRLRLRQRVALLSAFCLLLMTVASIGLHGRATAQDGKGSATLASTEDPAQPPTPPRGTIPLRGRVVAADGSPAAGATVWAARQNYGPLEWHETVADARGEYTLGLDPGTWYVWARKGTQGGEGDPGQGPSARLVAGRAPPLVTIHLEERGTFRGRLLQAEDGKPIAGGKLFVDAGLVLTTDAEGRFRMGGLSRAGHEAFVVAPGRMRQRVLFDTTARTDTELEVSVPRAGVIVGRVTDQAGKPIPGAYVGRYTSGSFFSINGLFVACDAQGRFVYEDAVPPGQPTRLTAGAPGYSDDEHEGLVVPEGGRPLEVEYRLRPRPDDKGPAVQPDPRILGEGRRTVTGVVRGPDKEPAAGVLVRWGYTPSSDAIETHTDKEGRFRLRVPDKADMLAVLPPAFLPEFPPVPAGGDQKVDVTLKEGHTARGWVLDESGKPIANVRVIAVTSSPDPRLGNPFWLTEAAARTDAEGRFTMKGVPAGARFDFLKARMSDLRMQTLALDTNNPVKVTMSHGGAIYGRVVDKDGQPIRNFRITVNFPRDRREGDQSGGYFAGFCGMGVRFTSADGSFVLTGVGSGSVHRIAAIADGYGAAVADRVVAIPLDRLAESKPVLLRAGAPNTLRVRVLTAQGKPVAGARVTLVDGDLGLDRSFTWGYHDASWEDMARARTAADGWAEFRALPFGGATLLTQAPCYGRQRQGWRDGSREVTVTLASEAAVTGRVLTLGGQPMKEFYATLSTETDQINATVSPDGQGRFSIAELPAGIWSLTIRDSDGLTTLHAEQFELKAGETKQVEIKTKKE